MGRARPVLVAGVDSLAPRFRVLLWVSIAVDVLWGRRVAATIGTPISLFQAAKPSVRPTNYILTLARTLT